MTQGVVAGEEKARLITFEGVDGCGKSTQLRLAAERLRAAGEAVVTTFEPGDTALGRELRRLLLDGEFVPVPEAELLLFLADRAQHVREVIAPALARGAWVLCDRYSDSTLAYQLAARQLADQQIPLHALLNFAECGVRPGLTLWFDLSVEQAAARMRQRESSGEAPTRLDDEQAAFHQRVAAAFAQQWQAEPERIARIDADRPIADVHGDVCAALARRLPLSAVAAQ